MKFFLLSSILVMISCNFCRSKDLKRDFPRVITPLGTIEGIYSTSSGGKWYEAYLGIPYARPVIKEQRFEIAKPIGPWTGILSAKKFGPWCSQVDVFSRNPSNYTVIGSEDCLYLNVYTPSTRRRYETEESSDLLPVIIYIYGGAFVTGSAAEYGPDYLLDKPVVLVMMNYRLGPLGFLSTEDDVVPGNMGLKDQVIAMHWVKKNILYFGGDPDRITLIGQGAGGASVHFHYLSEASRGLFNRGMSISGTALNCWSQSEGNLQKAKKLATIVGCRSNNVREMVNCLKRQPVEEIVLASLNFMAWLNTPFTPFGPVVELGESSLTFIDQPPIDSIVSGNVQDLPWITSVVSNEGLLPAAPIFTDTSLIKELDSDWNRVLPFLLDFNYTIPKSEQSQVSQLIREYYFGTKPIDESTTKRIFRMVGDRRFNYEAGNAAELQAFATDSPVRFFRFSYRGAHSASELYTGTSKNYGAIHSDDVSYVLKSFFDPTTTHRDRKMQRILIDLWVSYATDGLPDVGVAWPEIDSDQDQLEYLHILGPHIMYMDDSPNFGNREFWMSIPFSENVVILEDKE